MDSILKIIGGGGAGLQILLRSQAGEYGGRPRPALRSVRLRPSADLRQRERADGEAYVVPRSPPGGELRRQDFSLPGDWLHKTPKVRFFFFLSDRPTADPEANRVPMM